MINETFVATDPKSAYDQAVEKYGRDLNIVSAKQLKHDDGKLRCEVVIAVPKDLFVARSFGKEALGNTSTPEEALSSAEEEEKLLSEIETLRSQLDEMKRGITSEILEEHDIAAEVKALFMKKGIAAEWLERTLEGLIGSDILADKRLLVSYLLEEIDESLKLKEEDLTLSKVMMLVGPTGVGKTTTIAKLAARYAYLLDQPYRVALVNLDSYKVGAVEQLAHYAQIMQIEHFAISGVDAFVETMHQLETYDVVLIDTAGMSPYDTQKFIKTVEFVNADLHRRLEVSLVLPATVKYEDMEDIHKNFSFLNPDSVIITKFDETRHFGTLLNFMLLYGLPMSYFSTGQEVPDDLIVASKEYLLEQFIGDIHEG
jgi:flagellar biosynthesis protein FlhF